MNSTLSVVIVNYNAGKHLRRCLQSIVENVRDMPWEAVVVDNCSIDRSEEAVPQFAPQVTLIRNASNLGFGRAANQGAAATTGRYCLFLNPDTLLTPGALQRLCGGLEHQADCAVIAPSVVNVDGTLQGNARGDPTMLTGLFGRTSLLRRAFPGAAIARRNVVTDTASPPGEAGLVVDWVSGSCMLVRRDAFDRHHGFDERFFMYWEDADLCRRIRASGQTVRYLPEARVIHRVGRSSRTVPALAVRAFHRSAYLYYRQYVSSSRWQSAAAFFLLHARCQWHLGQLAIRGHASALEERDDVTIP
ncbi:MAG: glycosyltransferase family 2 protein [Acidobacteriota bacterium]